MTNRNEILTKSSLVKSLHEIGIVSGDVVLVHTAMQSLGYVVGGVQTIVESLLEAVGKEGTIIMPAFTGEISDPTLWKCPKVPDSWIPQIKEEMISFDICKSPTRGMGATAEYFRTFPGTVRSNHPQSSFCANGMHAQEIIEGHNINYRFGFNSPLNKIYNFAGKELLLGAPITSLTGLYFSDYMTDVQEKKVLIPVVNNEAIIWSECREKCYSSEWFPKFISENIDNLENSKIDLCNGKAIVFSYKQMVDIAVEWRKSANNLIN